MVLIPASRVTREATTQLSGRWPERFRPMGFIGVISKLENGGGIHPTRSLYWFAVDIISIAMDPSIFLLIGSVWGMIWGLKFLLRQCSDPYGIDFFTEYEFH